jgi:hypothetical protein
MDKTIDKTLFVLTLIMAECREFFGRSKIARFGFELPVPREIGSVSTLGEK